MIIFEFELWRLALPVALLVTLVLFVVLYEKYTPGQLATISLLWFAVVFIFVVDVILSFFFAYFMGGPHEFPFVSATFVFLLIAGCVFIPQTICIFLVLLLYVSYIKKRKDTR